MPLDLVSLVVNFQDCNYTCETDRSDRVESNNCICYAVPTTAIYTNIVVVGTLKCDVHAQWANNHDKGTNCLLHSYVSTETKVYDHKDEKSNEREERSVDRLDQVILEAHLLNAEEADEASEEELAAEES